MPAPVKSSQSRLFTIEDRAGPANVPEYQGRARAQGPSWSLGDRTPVREPDPTRYGAFRIVDAIKSDRERLSKSVGEDGVSEKEERRPQSLLLYRMKWQCKGDSRASCPLEIPNQA